MTQDVIVTTGDIKQEYEIIGPVYFQISNKPEGLSNSTFIEYREMYEEKINKLKQNGLYQEEHTGNIDWGCVWGEFCLGETAYEFAFFVAVEEIKIRARMLGADAVVFMRQDFILDAETVQYFHLQMYGTAVRKK